MILELFAGAGGASLGIHRACPDATIIGVEWDEAACRTRHAAGLLTIRSDVSELPTGPFRCKVHGLWCSPPCPQFSAAGKGAGNWITELLCEGIRLLLNGEDADEVRRNTSMQALPIITNVVDAENKTRRKKRTYEQVCVEARRRTAEACLVMEPARFAYDLRPEWVACEQVPAVLPIWRQMAHGLELLGYSTWAGQMDAADYGVAQNRARAVLMARLGAHPVGPPLWGMTERPAMTVAVGTGGGPDPSGVGGSGARRILQRERERVGLRVTTRGDSGRAKDEFSPDRPSRTVTKAAGSTWKRVLDGA